MGEFVLQVPKWQGELVFSKEVLIFLGVILLMIIGFLFCFFGYKFFGTILLTGIGTVMCYGSFLLVEPMTSNPVIRLFLTVSLTFLGVCLAYFLDIIWGFILDKLRIRNVLAKNIYLLAAPLGAAILGLTIYYMIWRGKIVAIAIAGVCLVIGLFFQFFKRKKQVRFRSYNDLMKLPLPERYQDGLEYISVGAAPTPRLRSVPVREEKPIVEAETESAAEPTEAAEIVPISAELPEEEAAAPVLMTKVSPEPEPEAAFEAEIEEASAAEPAEAEPDKVPVAESAEVAAAEAPVFVTKVSSEPELSEVSSEPELSEVSSEPEPTAAFEREIEEAPAAELTETELDEVPAAELTMAEAEAPVFAAEVSPEPVAETAPAPRAYSTDFELMKRTETVKNIILGEAISEKHIEEEALDDMFVKKTDNTVKAKRRSEKAPGRSKNTSDRSKSTVSDPRKVTIVDNQKITMKLDAKLLKSAALAAVSVGCFLAGRVSKDGD